jgi:hypothetical protein
MIVTSLPVKKIHTHAKLFMLLIGCSPADRNIEQHDIFFGIGESINDLIPDIKTFWPGENKLHLDAWREVTNVNGHQVQIILKNDNKQNSSFKLFFINLGGYKQNEFEEFHYKMIIAAIDKGEAINKAKQTAFFSHTGFKGATAHIDDKYGVDVDDMHEIEDILPNETKARYRIFVDAASDDLLSEDEIHLGYFKLSMFS